MRSHSDDQLSEVEKHLKKIAPPSTTKNIMKLKGIWKGKGFETINVEKEIQGIRKEVIQAIEKRDSSYRMTLIRNERIR